MLFFPLHNHRLLLWIETILQSNSSAGTESYSWKFAKNFVFSFVCDVKQCVSLVVVWCIKACPLHASLFWEACESNFLFKEAKVDPKHGHPQSRATDGTSTYDLDGTLPLERRALMLWKDNPVNAPFLFPSSWWTLIRFACLLLLCRVLVFVHEESMELRKLMEGKRAY